jgi:hypothetical protein
MKTRIFFTTYAIVNLGLIAYGLLALINPDILLETFLAHVYQFPPEASHATTYLSGLYRLVGYFNIIPGVVGLLILYRYWDTGRSWYLKIVIASTILSYLGPVVFDNTVGTIGVFEILEHIFLVMILITGFIMLRNENGKASQRTSRSNSGKKPPESIKPDYNISQIPGGKVYSNLERY